MRVKRYLVDTMPEAMLQIRNDLGGDAVILSTKETKVGGFLGMFRQKKIEVVAAVEKDEQSQAKKTAPAATRPSMAVPKKAVPQAYRKTAELTSAATNQASAPTAAEQTAAAVDIEQALKDMQVAQSMRQQPVDNRAASDTQSAHMDSPELPWNEIEANRSSAKAAERVNKAEVEIPIEKKSSSEAEERLLEELREMKAWMARISRQSAMRQTLPEPLQKLQDRLLQQEIESDIVQEWIESAYEHWEAKGRVLTDAELEDFMREQIKSFLAGRFGGGIASNTRMVYVAGPTGVGKTTTIAKLAAEQLFRYHRKVGFITSDTYRISAVEQLRTYASILNVPLEVVQSPGDMQRAIQRLSYCDLILMDTAGRNYRNELLVSELQSLFSPMEQSETYLVLSLTSKAQDMKRITEHFSKYGLDKVIFTKLDETGSYGSIINLIQEFPLNLSYMTNGQNVPDDLLLPEERTLTSLLLGEEGA
ncbi:flagellar biosynthesis protein FlhF [Paenibacillus chibensis]|uniref:flagellar biosynthesis protein FlhF n=1 Tax=Paenibacillus chibensis TaxID=59846 RepID=UPI000FDB8C31|nr:flagellar biosynthesis protein FlhF [Paenibacillus chibensis]MEC0373038.1 flagellar biosynthesis protein FlhF [Paenibacillus chibensis]